MAKYKYLVLAKPKEGREEEWSRWHQERHVPDMLRVPGIVSCSRFGLDPYQVNSKARQWAYMAMYEIETDDIERVLGEVRRRFGTPEMPTTDASDPGHTVSILCNFLSEHEAAASGADA